MFVSEKPKAKPHPSKGAILDMLAKKLNCERDEVNFLFGQNANALGANIVEIPDARFH